MLWDMVSIGRWNIRAIMYSWIITLVYCLLFPCVLIVLIKLQCKLYAHRVLSWFLLSSLICLLSNIRFFSYQDFNKTYWWNGANPLFSISCKTINAWLYQAGNVKHFLNLNISIRIIKTKWKEILRLEEGCDIIILNTDSCIFIYTI